MFQKSTSSFSRGGSFVVPQGKTPGDLPGRNLTIALSVQAKDFPQRFSWAEDNAFAMEYTPDPCSLELVSPHVKPYTARGIPVRFHCRYFDFEIGNADPVKAEEATLAHLRTIDAISGCGEPVVTVHMNLVPQTPFDSSRGVENLSRLVRHARKEGITVCLENLRRGPTSDPENIIKWAVESGAMITLDLGHAVSSDSVKSGRITVSRYVELFSERLAEVHLYGKEEDRHYPIEKIQDVQTNIDRLLSTRCSWWTIELDNYSEALKTRQIVTDYLNAV